MHMTIQERADKAVYLKTQGGYNCSQAVTAALADQSGLSDEQLKALTAGFCAGMGNLEATCGALLGAGMIAGLKSEGNGTLKMTRTMIETFKERCGATKCGDCVRNAVLIYGEVMGLE